VPTKNSHLLDTTASCGNTTRNYKKSTVGLPSMLIIIMVEIIVSIAGHETRSPLVTPRHGGVTIYILKKLKKMNLFCIFLILATVCLFLLIFSLIFLVSQFLSLGDFLAMPMF
jgi:hypothetical protein